VYLNLEFFVKHSLENLAIFCITEMLCGCMATRHPIHFSCRECGYIFCEKENKLEKCRFCEANLLPKMSADEAQMYFTDVDIIKAYKLKVFFNFNFNWLDLCNTRLFFDSHRTD
jgi:Fe2+ or Zn2+ uptake regulation protein